MPAIHLKYHGVDRPVCRWKDATRTYILTENQDEVTCLACMGSIFYHPQGETVKVQKEASLHEKAVQKVAKESITMKQRRSPGKRTRPASSRVVRKHWSDGLHPMIVAYVKKRRIPHTKIEVRGPSEILIRN